MDLTLGGQIEMMEHDCLRPCEHRRRLMPRLRKRTKGVIGFKHQNISAALMGLGEGWIPGYKPASNSR